MVVYCEHGPRAGVARLVLWMTGFTDVRYLDVLALPGGGHRIYYEARLPGGSHELRTELIPHG